jgi:D-3-phosphoglycerate dehydrogenase
MKPTARIINCARGGIINEADLAAAVSSGKIAGAALDVYAQEPLGESPLRDLGRAVVLTPHLGASTAEAQVNVAIDVAEQIRDVLLGLPARSAVNIPGLRADVMEQLRPYLQLAENLGNLVGQLAGGRVESLNVQNAGGSGPERYSACGDRGPEGACYPMPCKSGSTTSTPILRPRSGASM